MSQIIVWFCMDKQESVGRNPSMERMSFGEYEKGKKSKEDYFGEESIQLWICRFPKYYEVKKYFFRKKKKYTTWNKAALLQTMQNCCLTLCADKYYVNAELEAVDIHEPAFWNGKQRIEEELLKDRLEKVGVINHILWIPGKDSIYQNIPLKLLGKVQKFYVLSGELTAEEEECVRDTENFLWNEYGMPLLYIDAPKEISCKKEERLMVLYDADRCLSLKQIPCKILCVDLWSNENLHEMIGKERPDAKYFSEYYYLQKLVGSEN